MSLISFPSGAIINMEHVRAIVKIGINEYKAVVAGCPPLEITPDDYDYYYWLAQPVNPEWVRLHDTKAGSVITQ